MRITPQICFHCHNWFIPKTNRKNKYCSGACRQQAYLNKKVDKLYYEKYHDPITIDVMGDANAHLKLVDCTMAACSKRNRNCLLCLFENDQPNFKYYIYKFGRDKWGNSAEEWLRSQTALE